MINEDNECSYSAKRSYQKFLGRKNNITSISNALSQAYGR